MSVKTIITAGCSFSTVEDDRQGYQGRTWPFHLHNITGIPSIYGGRLSVGNGFISRSAIYNCSKALEVYEPHEILLGIMWSGRSRFEYFVENSTDSYATEIIPNNKNYNITNPGWDDPMSVRLNRVLNSEVGQVVSTIEHILRVQNYCKVYNIKYFMSQFYKDACLPNNEILQHVEVEYLYKQIDFDQFLPVSNMWDWCLSSGLSWDSHHFETLHPTLEQQEAFAKSVIYPFLKNKNYL